MLTTFEAMAKMCKKFRWFLKVFEETKKVL
jgi:hypothetical protein